MTASGRAAAGLYGGLLPDVGGELSQRTLSATTMSRGQPSMWLTSAQRPSRETDNKREAPKRATRKGSPPIRRTRPSAKLSGHVLTATRQATILASGVNPATKPLVSRVCEHQPLEPLGVA